MKRNIQFLAILLALAMQSIACIAKTMESTPVYLYYTNDDKSKSDGYQKPSKAPALRNITLSVFWDEEARQLVFSDTSDASITFTVYSEYEEVVSQGSLTLLNNESYYIDLSSVQGGTYTLVIDYNGSIYSGTFEL
ncbi:MAG: DUF3244 domain-containing protein [Prevotella sp.]|nr:DUF3244 domain-containing protein [Prevotella sp.]